MHHSFLQKLLLVVFAGFVAATVYVVVYKWMILGADQAVNGGYKPATSKAAAKSTPRRF